MKESEQRATDNNEIKRQAFASEKEALLQQLNTLSAEHAASTALLTEATHAWRRNEGMYIQLRQQFVEKSNALDSARYQLFHTQEHLARIQRDQMEATTYHRSVEDNALDRHIIHMEQLIQEYHEEIETLHDLVAMLNEK